MERETKTITTPNGHKVLMYAYVTGREQREINNGVYANAKVEVVNGQPVISDFKTEDVVNAVNDKQIQTLILEIDGQKENLIEKVLDLKAEDYNAIISTITEVMVGKKKD